MENKIKNKIRLFFEILFTICRRVFDFVIFLAVLNFMLREGTDVIGMRILTLTGIGYILYPYYMMVLEKKQRRR